MLSLFICLIFKSFVSLQKAPGIRYINAERTLNRFWFMVEKSNVFQNLNGFGCRVNSLKIGEEIVYRTITN